MLKFFKKKNRARRVTISASLSTSLTTAILYTSRSRGLEWRLYFIAIETVVSALLSFLVLIQDVRTIQMDRLPVQTGVVGPLIPLLYRTSSLGFDCPKTDVAEFILLVASALSYVLAAVSFFLHEVDIPEVAVQYLQLWHSIAYICMITSLLIFTDLFLLSRDAWKNFKESKRENEQ